MTSTTYRVLGMTCEHCVRAVTEELESVPGVSAVTIALVPGGESAVTVTSDAPLVADEVRAALDEAGDYHVASAGAPPVAAARAVSPAPGRALPIV